MVDKMTGTFAPEAIDPQDLQDVTENLNRLMHAGLYGVESPIERAMELIGDKYSFQIIHLLYQMERQRFVELEHQITGISPRTLSARLKHLEKFRLINRHQFPTIPPKVEYELTERGRDLASTLNSLKTWADRWFPYAPSTGG
ncbi:winged helix-turn-helix transcriptional regulator [Vampirovibrio sp.]|uniref:winged helix-turn-helix transcriptional regulator n=1 Tax=Vampirovibrio sp. TaxID=2717857 RepID=UPI00359455D0